MSGIGRPSKNGRGWSLKSGGAANPASRWIAPGVIGSKCPDNFKVYRKTAEFNERTIPPSLRRDHSTKAGVWAKIQVIEGKLNYRIDPLAAQFELSPAVPGIVIPEARHHLEAIGSVRFFVEFYKRAESDSDDVR